MNKLSISIFATAVTVAGTLMPLDEAEARCETKRCIPERDNSIGVIRYDSERLEDYAGIPTSHFPQFERKKGKFSAVIPLNINRDALGNIADAYDGLKVAFGQESRSDDPLSREQLDDLMYQESCYFSGLNNEVQFNARVVESGGDTKSVELYADGLSVADFAILRGANCAVFALTQ